MRMWHLAVALSAAAAPALNAQSMPMSGAKDGMGHSSMMADTGMKRHGAMMASDSAMMRCRPMMAADSGMMHGQASMMHGDSGMKHDQSAMMHADSGMAHGQGAMMAHGDQAMSGCPAPKMQDSTMMRHDSTMMRNPPRPAARRSGRRG